MFGWGKKQDTPVIHWCNMGTASLTACGKVNEGVDERCGPQRLTEAVMAGENVCPVCADKLREWSKR